MGQPVAYVIFTTPRSGSTLLCRLLAQTGVAGWPNSHFHVPSMRGWLDQYALDPESHADDRSAIAAVVDAAIARGTGDTGVFGMRLQRESFAFFLDQLAVLHPETARSFDRIEATFGRTLPVYLFRRDKLAQAISYVRAKQSGLWHRATDGTEIERLSPPEEPRYDADAIAARIETALAEEAAWRDWFAREDLNPITIEYGALAADHETILEALLGALGRPVAAARGIEPTVARLSDRLSADWARRFRRDRPEIDHLI